MVEVPEKEIMGHIADLFKGFADTTREIGRAHV